MTTAVTSGFVVITIGSQSIARALFRDISNHLGTGAMKQENPDGGETFWCYSRGQEFKATISSSGRLSLKGDRAIVDSLVKTARRRASAQGAAFEVLDGAQARLMSSR